MGVSGLSLILCKSPQIWDAFVAASPQGSIFCKTAFLNSLDVEYDLWLLEEGQEPQAGAVVLRNNDEVLKAPYPFTMYQGLLFTGDTSSWLSHRRTKWTREILETLLTGLTDRYDRLSFCLHHAHEDLRGIQWFHYHEPQLGQFKVDLYYTGLIDLRGYKDFEAYLATIRQTRRNLYRQALARGLIAEISHDIDTFNRLYGLTFERQGLELGEKYNLAHSIVDAALTRGFGELLLCRNEVGEAISATVFIYDEKYGYYLYGANDPAHYKTNGGTYLLLENIRGCQSRGLTGVDVVGINSPNRGDFKTSFNAVPTPYFVIDWERRNSIE